MRSRRSIRVLAAAGTIAGLAAPAAIARPADHAVPPTHNMLSAPAAGDRDSGPAWVELGIGGAIAVTLAGGSLGATRRRRGARRRPWQGTRGEERRRTPRRPPPRPGRGAYSAVVTGPERSRSRS